MIAAALLQTEDFTGDLSPDQDLIRRIVDRDEAALASLYDRYSSAALAVAFRILGDRMEAEDTLQLVFVKLWNDASKYESSKGSVATWIMSAIRNGSIDRIRRRQAYQQAKERAAQATTPVSVDPVFGEDHQRVAKAMGELPADQREAIEMAYYQGFSQSEIAQRLEQPLGTVKTRIRLGMIRLRQALGGQAESA